jgi:hypothetical protein
MLGKGLGERLREKEGGNIREEKPKRADKRRRNRRLPVCEREKRCLLRLA